ncbi:hypothetical protein EDD28_0053 [Salana multivorans]|uniref:Uncharacterized protein n=1 Tax=Salana multivorans TaxID=120377 RepID=A0A3N2D6T7_9MICO|nr:hypothetical protein [Salana multivorans]ROR95500.1 hypothetical protein EDD28_0053 [Salana multivorans]
MGTRATVEERALSTACYYCRAATDAPCETPSGRVTTPHKPRREAACVVECWADGRDRWRVTVESIGDDRRDRRVAIARLLDELTVREQKAGESRDGARRRIGSHLHRNVELLDRPRSGLATYGEVGW